MRFKKKIKVLGLIIFKAKFFYFNNKNKIFKEKVDKGKNIFLKHHYKSDLKGCMLNKAIFLASSKIH